MPVVIEFFAGEVIVAPDGCHVGTIDGAIAIILIRDIEIECVDLFHHFRRSDELIIKVINGEPPRGIEPVDRFTAEAG